jgi:CubicO group peptidase (beta-lactamase class C family)
VDHILKSVPVGGDLRFQDVPQLPTGFINVAPADRNDGLAVGELGVDGGNKDMIVGLAQEIAAGQHGSIDSLLIAHKGELVFESYYLRGRLNLTHPQASATKTYTGLALGRAIQLGYLTMADLDKPLVSFFNELDPAKFVEGAEEVTLHQALTMRSGIRISNEQRAEFDEFPDQVQGQGLVQTLFEKSEPIVAENLGSFSYGNHSSRLVMQVIDAVVPGTAEDFIKNELFARIGITTYDWRIGFDGLPSGGGNSSITSRDMVKLGILAMNNGKWNGEQLIPEAFVTRATSRIVVTGDDVDVFGGGTDITNQGYGYFWWNADMKAGDRSYFASNAQGGGGQFIILIEELDLVVVVTGHDRENSTLQATAQRILPAFAP